jgi:hypothetical protein
MFLGTNAALRGCQEYFNRCAAAGSPIGATQTPTAYDNAASFNGTNQFLSIPSNSSLTVTGTSFTFAFWANTPNTSSGMVISKSSGSDTREFQIVLNTGGALGFTLFPNGTFAGRKDLNSGASSFLANTWNFFVCQYDSSGGGTMGISINGQAFNSLGSVGAITQTNTNTLTLGCFINTATGFNYTGQLAGVGFWKRALSASEVTQLFNSGAGRTYASLDTGLRTNLISWWALNQNSVTADSHGTNTLTNNGTVTAPNIGPVVTSLADPRQLIIDFAQGIDRLGLWNSMVCWPLRSSQNAGSGTTAFSLGGLGQFDGALINSPSRGANGMIFASASGTRINISNDPIFAPQNTTWGAMAVSNQTSMPGGYGGVFGKNNVNEVLADIGWNLREVNTNLQPQVSNGTTQALYNIASVGFNSFRSSMFSYDNVNVTGRVNGGSAVSSPYTPNAQQLSSQTLRIGSGPTGATATYYNGQIAFALFGYFSASQQVAIHSLYRQTLGLGLGLP